MQSDLTLKPCYIAKVDNCFAHGDTLRQAFDDAKIKAFEDKSDEERIDEFLQAHTGRDVKYPAEDLFRWHGLLTGSCTMGRKQFVKEHSIDMQTDSFTLAEFIKLTEYEYGKEIIKQLKERL